MARFLYKAISSDGETIQGEMEAPSRTAVIERLQESGHLPILADELGSADGRRSWLAGTRLFFRPRRMSRDDVALLTRQLSTMLRAGVPLDSALGMLIDLAARGPVRQTLERIRELVHGGASLSDALAAQPGVFGRFYLSMIRAGEASGALEAVLARLCEYFDRSKELRETVKSALVYPAILVVVAGISLIVLVTFVVPQFTPLFEDLGGTLPLATRIVITVAEFVRNYWWLLVMLVVAVYWLIQSQLSDPKTRDAWDAVALKIPLLSDLITKVEVARFSRTLGTLLVNGVPMLAGVSITREILGNRVLANALQKVSVSLEQGRGMATPLLETGCFPSLAVQLVRIGEETGKLEEMLLQIADIYDTEVRDAVKRLLALLEPVLILGMGVLIAAIIMSILVAILSLNELVF